LHFFHLPFIIKHQNNQHEIEKNPRKDLRLFKTDRKPDSADQKSNEENDFVLRTHCFTADHLCPAELSLDSSPDDSYGLILTLSERGAIAGTASRPLEAATFCC
jgi:hypothetical protein